MDDIIKVFAEKISKSTKQNKNFFIEQNGAKPAHFHTECVVEILKLKITIKVVFKFDF